jgi:hypothetical protein
LVSLLRNFGAKFPLSIVGIAVPEASGLRLVKRYAGPEGSWRFPQDFSNGSHEFRGVILLVLRACGENTASV